MAKNRKGLKIFCIVIAVIAILWVIMAILPRVHGIKGENTFMVDDQPTMLIAHGGGNREFPDNTMEAYYNAYSIDPNVMLESDASITKDGVLIMSHDTTLDYRTSARGAIADWNYTDLLEQKVDFSYLNKKVDGVVAEEIKYTNYANEEVTPLDVTYPDGVTPRDNDVFLVTTFEQMLVAFPNNLINIEIKQKGELGQSALDEAIRLVEKHNAFDRVMFASFHTEIFNSMADYYKEYAKKDITFLFSPEYVNAGTLVALDMLALDFWYMTPVSALQLPPQKTISGIKLTLDNASFVKMAHKHNIAVQYWTIDDEETMKQLIEIDADGIMTNRPTLLKQVIDSYK